MTDTWEHIRNQEQYVTVDGIETRYFDFEDGPLILLMHGGGLTSCADLSYGAVLKPLSERCRVVAADQPGFGFTPPRDERDYNPRERADFMLKFIEELDLDSVTVVGHSRSGFMAAYMALVCPDVVEKLVLVAAGSASRKLLDDEMPGDLSTDKPTRESAREYIDDARRDSFVTPEHHPFWRAPTTQSKVDYIYEIQERNWEFTRERHEANQTSPERLNQALSHEGRHTTEFAPDITQPTLLTWSRRPYPGWPRKQHESEEDMAPKTVTVTPDHIDSYQRDEGLENGFRLFEKIPNAEIHVWQNAKHSVHTDRAPRWSDVVAGFANA